MNTFEKKIIPIVFAFDSNYIRPAAVAISSLLVSAYEGTFYKIYILVDLLFNDELKNKFRGFLGSYSSFSLEWITVDNELFTDAPLAWNNSKVTYYRLLLPKFVEEEKVIWSDVDVLFTGDLADVYSTCMDDYYWAGVVAEYNIKARMHTYFSENKNELIYMPGFMLMNLKKMRNENIIDKFFANIKKYSNRLKMFDLDILNISCDKIKSLPFSYCVLENLWNNNDIRNAHEYTWLRNYYSHSQLLEAKRNTQVIHYAGTYPKIWNRDYSNIANEYLLYLAKVDKYFNFSNQMEWLTTRRKTKLILKNTLKVIYKKYFVKARDSIFCALSCKYAFLEVFFLRKKLMKNTIGPSIVIIEPNNTHYELIPSCVNFFLDLGYYVHVVVRNGFLREYPFVIANPEKLFIYECNYSTMHLLVDRLDQRIDFFFLTTSVVYTNPLCDFLSFHEGKLKTKYGGVALLHDMKDIHSKQMQLFYNQNRLLTIGKKDERFTPIYPVVFNKTIKRGKNLITKFIVVGAFEKERRDYDLLEDATRFLLRNKVTNFEVLLVGKPYSYVVPDDLTDHFHLWGRVDFLQLSRLIATSDFILPLLNKNIKEHLRYKRRVSSGTKQLVYAYRIPCIVDSFFLKSFDLSEDMAITYADQKLEIGLLRAVRMPAFEYQTIVDTLLARKQALYEESLVNIKTMLDNICTTGVGRE